MDIPFKAFLSLGMGAIIILLVTGVWMLFGAYGGMAGAGRHAP